MNRVGPHHSTLAWLPRRLVRRHGRHPGRRGGPRLDPWLLLGLFCLMGLGLMVLYSASDQNTGMVLRQAVRLAVGVGVMLGISLLPPRLLRLWAPWLWLAGLVLLALTLAFGVGRGAQRWLDLGFMRFQPSEVMKLAVPLAVAAWLHPRLLPPHWRDLGVVALLIAVPAVMIALQPDLGTALMVALAGALVVFLAGLRWWLIGAAVALAAAAAPLLWMVMHEYQRNRIRTFLNPESDPLGQGWNIIQSKIAAGSGGLSGKGWLQGTQSHLEFLPERHTDFILAVFAEEFGLLGVAVLFALYLFVVIRGLQIAGEARDTFGRLIAGSLSLTFFFYILVNAGMVAGLLPVVGVPLPLISYGGTAMVTLLAGFGIVLSVHAHRRFLD